MTGMRSYGDPCGIARALDLVGERWALLVVREMLLGAKRFTDLRGGLPNASPNVLSQRLRELEEAGIVRRRRLDPPAGVWVYELTDRGRDLEPLILDLARWGSRSLSQPDGDLSVDSLMIALLTTFDPDAARGRQATVELRLGDDRFRAEIAKGQIDVARGHADRPKAVISTDAATLTSLVFGDGSLAEARRAGHATVEGDIDAMRWFLRLFPRPVPVASGEEQPAAGG
ncbi:MAG TPA: winged helix-turn-helix transcriptional regulator [Acidimicrobiales bacterium]|jgi:DNA-binding HxlR family transcriptional regulator